MKREAMARLPMFGWAALRGPQGPGMPCVLDLPSLHYTTSGRAAILLALEALGIGPGDRVLLPTYHCPTMVAPADSLGAQPLFYPINEQGTPDLAWIVRQPLDNVRVMLAAHFFGLPQPMDTVRRWCDDHGIALIEDCAHALFGRSGARAVGAWGDIAIASLTKFLPVNEGGCLVFNTMPGAPSLQAPRATTQVRSAIDILDVGATQGALPGLNGLVTGTLTALRKMRPGPPPAPAMPSVHGTFDDRPTGSTAPLGALDIPEHPDGDFTIDTLQAHRALASPCRWLAARLPRQRIVERRRHNFQRLLRELGNDHRWRPLFDTLPDDCAPYVFPLWVERPDPGYSQLRRLGMPVFRWDRLWPGTRAAVADAPHDQGLRWSHHVLQLACHQDLSDDDLTRLVAAIRQTYAGHPATPACRRGGPTAAHPTTPL
ncbi:MAG: DegT/DnrJ/EryC1/StrS family aminotransferase [Pseudomonadota bacterium]|nr:DegT/DnrJ/EryC1/StrS family aminotransferase [Pseudomonadota bacterium]